MTNEIFSFLNDNLENLEGVGNIIEKLTDSELKNNLLYYFNITNEKKRNLILKIAKIIKSENLDISYTEEDLKNKFYFKKSDIIFYGNKIFKNQDYEYILTDEVKKEIKIYQTQHEENKHLTSENEYNKKFLEIKDIIYNFKNHKNSNKKIEELIPLAEKLHWKYLPIYDENIMRNREIIPEEDLRNYYKHFHTLEDLFDEINKNGIKWKSLEGDENLNKDLEFKVYTSRWGHEDNYSIKRTILDGM